MSLTTRYNIKATPSPVIQVSVDLPEVIQVSVDLPQVIQVYVDLPQVI